MRFILGKIYLGLVQDFGVSCERIGAGGEVGRACAMTEKFSFPPRKLNFTGGIRFDRSLSIKPRKQLEINMADLYFGSCDKISGHSKRSVPTERTASYISEEFALKS